MLLNDMEMLKDAIFDVANVFTVGVGLAMQVFLSSTKLDFSLSNSKDRHLYSLFPLLLAFHFLLSSINWALCRSSWPSSS